MSASPLVRLAIILDARCVDPGVTGQDRYRTVRHIARMIPATDRM